LYTGRYTLPEVTITGDKKKVGTGMGKRLYMHPWKTVGDLSREQHEAEEIARKSFSGGEQMYNLITKDLNKPLSPVDPVGEFVVGNAILNPMFKYAFNGIGPALSDAAKASLKNVSNFHKAYKISKAINKGVRENPVITAYNRNPATKDLGTLWDYQSYLNDTFPNSKIKDVLWHGSKVRNLQSFSTDAIGSNAPIKGSTGIYLAPERYTAASYGRNGDVYPVLLNTENPFVTDQMFAIKHNGVNVANISPKTRNTILRNNDAVVATKRGEIAFFEPDNALILGSNKDLNRFKTYVLKSKNASARTN